jgi:hypothetical protein
MWEHMRTNTQNVYKMCFVLQIINFHIHNTSLKKNKNNKGYLQFLLADFHTCIFCNTAVSKKKCLSCTKNHSFHSGYQNVDDSLIYIGNICCSTIEKRAR